MIKNNWTYSFINIFIHKEDTEAYKKVFELFDDDEYITVIDNIFIVNGKEEMVSYLGFKSYGADIDDITPYKDKLKYRVIPFVFKHDKDNRKFVDAVTGERYSYHTYDDCDTERKFYQDKGQTGEYIEAIFELDEEGKRRILNSLSNNDVQTYRKALRRLEELIKKGYSDYYLNLSKEKRARERNTNKGGFTN
jgi:hypothetical protein